MDGIIINIIAYFFLSLVLFRYLIVYKDNHSIYVKFFVLAYFLWTLFFLGYLVVNYNSILEMPLNKQLNWYEVISNFYSGVFLFFNIGIDRYKRQKTNYNENHHK